MKIKPVDVHKESYNYRYGGEAVAAVLEDSAKSDLLREGEISWDVRPMEWGPHCFEQSHPILLCDHLRVRV